MAGTPRERGQTLPLPPRSPRLERDAVITFPYRETASPIDVHFRATQLAVCRRQIAAHELQFQVSVYPHFPAGDAPPCVVMYVALRFSSPELPVLPQHKLHVTIGRYMLSSSIDIAALVRYLDATLARFTWGGPLAMLLEPYGKGSNWQFCAGHWGHYLLACLRKDIEQAWGVQSLWLPDFHVTWQTL